MCAMDAKLNSPKVVNIGSASRSSSRRGSFFSFVQELKNELQKVSWTTRKELQLSTKVVIGAIFFLGIGIYLVDLVVKTGLDLIGMVARVVFG